MRKIKVLLSVILFSTATAFAQQNSTDVNDSELKKFATVYKKVQEVSRESQNKMVEIVQNEGIEVQRYNIIMRTQEDPSQKITVSEDELKIVKTINSKLKKIEENTNKKLQETIKENKLTVNRYQEILASIQSNPDLQTKLQEYLQE
ncbi:MAG: DUF4168 domain-containing protein [Prolixibacteraceae bacterium]|nr:DUF4168 domain-containing protein [Prolixibacteraceae bacterium]